MLPIAAGTSPLTGLTPPGLARGQRVSARPQEAARRLFEVEARSGSYAYDTRSRHLTPLGTGEHLEGESAAAEVELTRAYLRWCERTGRPGDCLRLLTENPIIAGDGRFALALALARGAVLDEMLEAFKGMADPHAMVAAVLWTWTTYMVLLSIPDVTVSKGIAAVMTVTLISYVGVDTFWGLVVGFKRLMGEADRATTFHELREAGERYGKVMGRNAARAFALLAMVAIGNTVPGLAAQVPKLPGAMQAVAQAESQVGIRLAAVGEVETVAVSAGTVTIALAPNAVAMAARGGRENDHGAGRTHHGQQRADEARGGDTHRQVGDANRVIITSKDGQIVTQFRNPRANTQSRIQSGRWVPEMSSSTLYRLINVCRRLSDNEAVLYRCFELIPEGGFVVQSADRIKLPVSREHMQQHERQLWELFCEVSPEERSRPFASIEEAIAAFDAEFGN